jgi:hypothetical protein
VNVCRPDIWIPKPFQKPTFTNPNFKWLKYLKTGQNSILNASHTNLKPIKV